MIRELKAWLANRYAPSTQTRYMRGIQAYLDQVGMDGIQHVKYREIWSYIGRIRSRGYSQGYVQTELAAVKIFHSFLVRSGYRTDDPTCDMVLRDSPSRHAPIQFQDLFSGAELELLLQRPSRYRLLENRDKLAISFYVRQAMTTGEISRILHDHVSWDEGTIFIPGSRKMASRILPLERDQLHWLEGYMTFDRSSLLGEKESDHLLVGKLGHPASGESLHYLIESQRDLFPARTLNPRTIRQSVIVGWFHEGKGIKDVQWMAGHKFASTTERYKPKDLGPLSDSVDRFHPLGGSGL